MSCTTAVPRLTYMYANLTWWCHDPSLASTDLSRLPGLHAAKTSKHLWRGTMWRYLSLQRGGGSPENCPTQGSSTESSQENRPIIWSHVSWWMLLSSDPMSLAHPSLWLKQLSKTMGSLTRHPPKTNNKDTIQKKSPISPVGSFMKIVLANT